MYMTQSEISDDPDMQSRVAQCAAAQGITDEGIDPDTWAREWRRTWAAAPGWDDAWESALAANEGDDGYSPGSDPAVITDDQILSQVQSMMPFQRVSAQWQT